MKTLKPEAVLDDGLLTALAALFDMDRLYGGERVRRDERGSIRRDEQGRKVTRPVARSLWVAEIRPAHMDPACLAVVTTEEWRKAGLVIETHPWVAEYPPAIMPIVPPALVRIGPMAVDAEWTDPVVAALDHLTIWPYDPAVVLDGRAYALFAGTADAQIALTFANPLIPSLMDLERGLLHVGQMLVAHDSTGALASYIEEWARYTRLRPQPS